MLRTPNGAKEGVALLLVRLQDFRLRPSARSVIDDRPLVRPVKGTDDRRAGA